MFCHNDRKSTQDAVQPTIRLSTVAKVELSPRHRDHLLIDWFTGIH